MLLSSSRIDLQGTEEKLWYRCGSVARAGELSGSSMYLFDPSLEADVELANLTAFMRV